MAASRRACPALWHQQRGAAEPGQELRQVWFAGVHYDAGGGYRESGLSGIPLLWTAGQAHKCGLRFRPCALGENGPGTMGLEASTAFRVWPDGLGRPHASRTGGHRLAGPLHRPIGRAVHLDGFARRE